MLIRQATSADRTFVRELSTDAFAPFGDYRELLPRWLSEPGVATFVGVEEGAPVGFSMVGYYYGDAAKTWCYADLLAIAVRPGDRRRGYGRLLLRQAIEAAGQARRSLPVKDLRLTVADTNPGALALFTGAGFTPLPEDHGVYDGGQRALRMRRVLP